MTDLSWLEQGDIIDSGSWVRLDDEVDGSTPDLCWVENTLTRKRALFKPDTFDGTEAYREYVTYKIATFLEIACAKIEVGDLFGGFGCLSYDCNTERRYRVSDGYSIYRCDALFNTKKSDTNNVVYDSFIEVSFKGLRPYITKETEDDLLNMMFLDCLVLNPDRHGGNYSFYINNRRVLCGLMSLYDHGLCMRNDLRDVSLFPYEGRQELSFKELFEAMNAEYPGYILYMMEKVKSSEFGLILEKLGCEDFILARIATFSGLLS